VTAPVPRFATDDDHLLLGGYAQFSHRLGLTDRALRDRLRLARAFLAEHPDLGEWMTQSTRTRLADLRRVRAWPLLSWAALSGRVHADLDLLAAKDLGSMSATVRQLWPEDFERLWETARRLGRSYYWARSVIDQFLPAVIAWSQTTIPGIDAEALDRFAATLEEVTSASATTLKQWHGRLFGLRQLLFEYGQLPEPPKRGPSGASAEERLAVVPAPQIRRAMARYVRTRAAVLSRSSADGLLNDLIPFGGFLGAQFPAITSLAQLERHHIEAFLAWNQTRTWRGRVARDQRVSAAAVHGAVLTVRNFLDDITLWGWADRPQRRLIFASDVPRLPGPLPRALAPDADAALMAAAGCLDDPFARSAILLLRRSGLRLGSASTSSSAASSTTAPPAPGCASRSASSAPSARSRLTPPLWTPSTPGPSTAASSGRTRTRAPASPPTSCSPSTAGGSAPGGSARACAPPSQRPVWPGPAGSRST
jgi:hypothetical protein